MICWTAAQSSAFLSIANVSSYYEENVFLFSTLYYCFRLVIVMYSYKKDIWPAEETGIYKTVISISKQKTRSSIITVL
jgi:hypothetical protein